MSKPKEKIVIKKVQPYPISADFVSEKNPQPVHGNIQRVERLGMQVDFDNSVFKLGETTRVTFEIPVMKIRIEEELKVVKTIIRYLDEKKTVRKHMVEFHFKALKPESASAITAFAVNIGQKP